MGKPVVPLDELAPLHNQRPLLSYATITRIINGAAPGRNFQASGLASAAKRARETGDRRFQRRKKYAQPELSSASDRIGPQGLHW